MIEEAISNTLASFDFSFCIVVNIITYLAIKFFEECDIYLSKWWKRVVLIVAIILISLVYFAIDVNNKLVFNSAILAPVFWSWVFKPICKHYNIDYERNSK